jgi:hypothetical protein
MTCSDETHLFADPVFRDGGSGAVSDAADQSASEPRDDLREELCESSATPSRRTVSLRGRVAPLLASHRLLMLTGGLHLSKGQLVDLDGRLQARQWDDDVGKPHWKGV